MRVYFISTKMLIVIAIATFVMTHTLCGDTRAETKIHKIMAIFTEVHFSLKQIFIWIYASTSKEDDDDDDLWGNNDFFCYFSH